MLSLSINIRLNLFIFLINLNFACSLLHFFYIIWIHVLRIGTNNIKQNIWNIIEKSSKSRQEKKSLISTFACFWLLLRKFNFWKRDWALGYVFTQI